jgi:hypothetical protein
MADFVFLALAIGFFALMVLLVRACDHVIGTDAPNLGGAADDSSRRERKQVAP